MNKVLNVLITGCGGDIGQSIGKIILKYPERFKLFGCDISDKNAAKFIFPSFSLLPQCSDPNYLNKLEEKLSDYKIDLLIPVSEPELRLFANIKMGSQIGKVLIVKCNLKSQEIGFDKMKTVEFLKSKGLPFPKTQELSDHSKVLEFPVIVKSRTGRGSSSVDIVNNLKQLNYLKINHTHSIVQELISNDNGEFTCGLFRSINGEIRSIILKRELTGGYSGYGEVIHNQKVSIFLEKLAIELNLVGSINVQLRLKGTDPIVFEINPRFSSTVLFRHLFGFEDVIWSIDDVLNLPIKKYEEVESGRKFYKGFNEYID